MSRQLSIKWQKPLACSSKAKLPTIVLKLCQRGPDGSQCVGGLCAVRAACLRKVGSPTAA